MVYHWLSLCKIVAKHVEYGDNSEKMRNNNYRKFIPQVRPPVSFFKMKGLFKKLTQVSTVNAEMEM